MTSDDDIEDEARLPVSNEFTLDLKKIEKKNVEFRLRTPNWKNEILLVYSCVLYICPSKSTGLI